MLLRRPRRLSSTPHNKQHLFIRHRHIFPFKKDLKIPQSRATAVGSSLAVLLMVCVSLAECTGIWQLRISRNSSGSLLEKSHRRHNGMRPRRQDIHDEWYTRSSGVLEQSDSFPMMRVLFDRWPVPPGRIPRLLFSGAGQVQSSVRQC